MVSCKLVKDENCCDAECKTDNSILGCGWLGKPLAVSLLDEGFNVKGSTTSEEKLTF